ncbi:23S rRNA (adenine(2030)-N(6))-methyltransferase RlmJ [Marinobacterium arenosum]|uniref:23S rRNA (adenine(2030)-N(6))-methyltransferase RlmJ n=1 Tax=Marinobacterium arenosum TaxID=2862496 RepID=UPI001C94F6DE|nr:23S rRNA (adenine(2030)-N(6))-methyltransferase RlmJ [Marinobacterium arenosum]MBY4679062.1 23S rRNA (adenine(2030)-N(6))-methyltransferase RlmJ [Marinobacterium arenosum]
MLSYRHSFHAGNHADMLKHAVQALILDKLKAKAKPFIYLDSHSGAGLYDLHGDEARKTAEFRGGIERLLAARNDFSELADFFAVINSHNRGTALRHYPGSPEIARQLMREQDRLMLMELHNNEVEILKANMAGDPRIAIHHRDGFEGLPALLPPTPARGLALIDPSYELKTDYDRVVSSIRQANERWPIGCYAIWYPRLGKQRDQSATMLRQLAALPLKNLLVAELSVAPQSAEFGMHGSGMAILNAPWQLDSQLASLLPRLHDALAPDGAGDWSVRWLIEPD